MAHSLKAQAPDLTRISLRNGGRFPLERVQRIILGEAQPESSHGKREMPLWGPIFSQTTWDENLGRVRIRNLAKYLEKIQAN